MRVNSTARARDAAGGFACTLALTCAVSAREAVGEGACLNSARGAKARFFSHHMDTFCDTFPDLVVCESEV
jgi:hypothetical protein